MVYGVFEPLFLDGFLTQEIGFILRQEVRGTLQIEYDSVKETINSWLIVVYEDRMYEEEMDIQLGVPPINALFTSLKQFQQIYSGLVDLKLGELK